MEDKEGCDAGEGDDHSPVCIAGNGFAVEANIDSGEEGAEDQSEDANVVDAEPEIGNFSGMAHQCVVDGG